MTEQWSNDWNKPIEAPKPPHWTSKYDKFERDFVLQEWEKMKVQLAQLKEQELEMRKYVVNRAFPDKHEGMNTLELGNGYQLKAGVKFNYKLLENDTVEACLNRIAKIGNEGAFIADRLVSWHPAFLLSEFRNLESEAEKGNETAKAILKECHLMLEISDAASTLTIKEPKK